MFPPKEMKALIKRVSEERLAICNECEHHSKNKKTLRPDDHCTHCGCTLSAKTKCLSCSCPLEKWVALVSSDEEEQIKKYGK